MPDKKQKDPEQNEPKQETKITIQENIKEKQKKARQKHVIFTHYLDNAYVEESQINLIELLNDGYEMVSATPSGQTIIYILKDAIRESPKK